MLFFEQTKNAYRFYALIRGNDFQPKKINKMKVEITLLMELSSVFENQ